MLPMWSVPPQVIRHQRSISLEDKFTAIMKMFVYRPHSYGDDTFMVMHEDEAKARQAVKAYAAEQEQNDIAENLDKYIQSGHYIVEVYEAGSVTNNANQ